MQIINKVVDIVFKGFDLYDAVRAKFLKDDGAASQLDGEEKTAKTAPEKAAQTKAAADSVVQNASKKETVEAITTLPKDTELKTKSQSQSKKQKTTTKANSKRKGSVDRSGKDIESVEAEKITAFLQKEGLEFDFDALAFDNKAVVGRVLWCLYAAQKARVRGGLSTKDMAALIYQYFDVEIYPTNLARACRNHKNLFETGETRDRSKCYVLTQTGKKEAKALFA